MQRPIAIAAALTLALVASPATAGAADQRCSNRDAGPNAISISYRGDTNCAEAVVLARTAPIKRGTRTVRLSHSTWRCTTVSSRRAFGVLEAKARTTCNLRSNRWTARVRWYVH